MFVAVSALIPPDCNERAGFLCLTMVFSWLWANLFFMTCMATFGPEGHERYLGFVCKRRPTAGSDSRSGTASAMTA